MARPRSASAIGAEWERHRRFEEEKARRNHEQQRQNEFERIRAQIPNPPFRNTVDEGTTQEPPNRVSHNRTVHELEGSRCTRPFETPPTPPASEHDNGTDSMVFDLKRQIDSQSIRIRVLESELRYEQVRVRDLKAARDEAESAQREAVLANNDAELARRKDQVTKLLELLDQSRERERDLERKIDEGRSREGQMRRELLEAERRANDLERSVNTRAVTRTPQPVQVWSGGGERNEQAAEPGWQQQQTAMREANWRRTTLEEKVGGIQIIGQSPQSGRSRRHAKQMERGYISIPKASGRHVRLAL